MGGFLSGKPPHEEFIRKEVVMVEFKLVNLNDTPVEVPIKGSTSKVKVAPGGELFLGTLDGNSYKEYSKLKVVNLVLRKVVEPAVEVVKNPVDKELVIEGSLRPDESLVGGSENEDTKVEDEASKEKEESFEDLSFKELQALVSERNLTPEGKSRDALIKALTEGGSDEG